LITKKESGSRLLEALAQSGGVLSLIKGAAENKIAFFMTIDKVKFRKPVVPGDQLILKVEVIKVVRGSIVKMHGEASVDGEVVCEGDLMFTVTDKG